MTGGRPGGRRNDSAQRRLIRLGFTDPGRAATLLGDPSLEGLGIADTGTPDPVTGALATVAGPDQALLGLVRLVEAARAAGDDVGPPLVEALRDDATARARLLAVLGSSTALVDHLVAHPRQWREAVTASHRPAESRVTELVDIVTDPGSLDGEPADLSPLDALRIGYRRQLLGIAAIDVASDDPVALLPDTAAALADLAGAALEAALRIARAEVEGSDACRLAVIGMGKAGGRELNYVSDVDVIFVAEPADGVEEDDALAAATKVATRLMHACSASTGHGTLWPVDAALRPEGKQGPLVRTVASHRAYYERWAKTWEFQALLKARPMAGDPEVGAAYLEAVTPLVWQAASRENFVEDVQAMRRRVEEHVPAAEASRQIKLGPGGLRDVEFSVQLLQLVHGRCDESLRSRTTLDGLASLGRGGYVGREDARTLDEAYRFLRTIEHRVQLHRLRRTHLMPTTDDDLRRLGRSLGLREAPADSIVRRRREVSLQVREVHQQIFYRPLLAAAARLSADEARLSPDAALERLRALGFRDPKGSMRHLERLTGGVSRTAAIQRQLLPVMLGWFAEEADPDAGLLAFRKVSDALGSTPWYLKMLRDEGRAAEILAHTLGRSRFTGEMLLTAPDAVRMLGEPDGLVPRGRAELLAQMQTAAGRQGSSEDAMDAARAIRRRELFRIAVADLEGEIGIDEVGTALTDLTSALVDVALDLACAAVATELGLDGGLGVDVLVVGMGRFGGRELGYASDTDVVFVHRAHEGTDERTAAERALAVVTRLRQLTERPGPDPAIQLDADLRPEGRNGPMTRSLEAFRQYYERWSLTWEAQALVRATPMAGPQALADALVALIDPLRWPAHGLKPEQVRDIRRLKARMEAERLPRGADRKTHFKLGAGGLSDVEWTVQLLQMEHAHEHPELRTTSTTAALDGLVATGLLSEADAGVLRESWCLASRLRNAGVLFRGRPVDAVPSNLLDIDGMGRIIGLQPQAGEELGDRYRRAARHARAVVDRIFYGET